MKVSLSRRRWWSSFLSSLVLSWKINVSGRVKSSSGELSYQVQNRHFHHTLVEVCCAVLDDFYSHDLLSLEILTLDDLAESALTQNIEDKVPIPVSQVSTIQTAHIRSLFIANALVTSFFRAQYVVHIEDVVAVFVVVSVVLHALAWLR